MRLDIRFNGHGMCITEAPVEIAGHPQDKALLVGCLLSDPAVADAYDHLFPRKAESVPAGAWISVEDELPRTAGRYLVLLEGKESEVRTCSFHRGRGWGPIEQPWESGPCFGSPVAHWRELPKAKVESVVNTPTPK